MAVERSGASSDPWRTEASPDTWTVGGEARGPPEPRVVADRYELGERLGAGSFGEVWAGRDRITGREVAVKFLHNFSSAATARFRREVALLRALDLPGVVRLVDEGRHGGDAYFVMQRVRGTPFPGAHPGGASTWTWDELAPRVARLLDVLGRIHAAGVVHRDVKPSNVLVDADGRAWLLDFGVARAAEREATITRVAELVGTARYFAPEQAQGLPADARADLFAVGVMVWEALTGRPLQQAESTMGLVRLRATVPAPSITSLVHGLPPDVAATIDRLLAIDPARRPASAWEVAQRARLGIRAARLPRVGPDRLVDALVEAARAGRSFDIDGPAGSGRSSTLEEAARRLDAEGRTVVRLQPSPQPLGALLAWFGPPGDPARVLEEFAGRLAGALGDGTVVIVDDADRHDAWTRTLLDAARGRGTVLRVARGGAEVPPLSEEDLRALFLGPERLLHLPSDAAAELHRRTGGLPRRVVEEVTAWVASDLAEVDPAGRLRVSRAAIDRLAGGLRLDTGPARTGEGLTLAGPQRTLAAWIALAWPRAEEASLAEWMGCERWQLGLLLADLAAAGHARRRADGVWEVVGAATAAPSAWTEDERRAAHQRVAERLEPGTEGRLGHLVAAGDLDAVVDESLLVAGRLIQSGNAARAVGILETALLAAGERSHALDRLEALYVHIARAALAEGTRGMLDQARGRLEAAVVSTPEVGAALALLAAAARAVSAPVPRLVDELGELRLDDPDLDQHRQALRVRIAREVDPGRVPALLDFLDGWAGADPGRRSVALLARGMAAYYAEDYEAAARLREEAASLAPSTRMRLEARVSAAAAWLDGHRPEAARRLAEAVVEGAREARLPVLEGRATWVLRSAAYRAGEDLPPDLELVEAVRAARLGPTDGQVLLTEAAFAWRRGEREVARRLTREARASWVGIGFADGVLLADALLWELGEPPPDGGLALVARARASRTPGLAVQALGLATRADPRLAPEARPVVARFVRGLPRAWRRVRMEVLEPDEALSYCRGVGG